MYSRIRTRSNLLALLRTIGKGDEFPPLSSFTDKQVRWVIKTGLAPLVCFASRNDSNRIRSSCWPDLKAADLTSRLVKEIELETLSEILGKCNGIIAPLTLLKGCSIASGLYPEPHFRLMRDIDVLVRPEEQPILESILNELGFRQQSANDREYYLTHHHSMPFYHSGKGIWVEVHRALFPPSQLAELPVFSRQNITAESKLSSLSEIPVMRLSTELQIVYTACHWALNLIDLKREGGLFALVDVIYLLLRGKEKIRWNWIFDSVQNSVAGTHLYLVLSYLYRKKIVDLDKHVLPELFKRQRSFGSVNLKVTHHLITRYLVEGKTPLAQGKLSILWKNLLHDQPPLSNVASFCREMLKPGPAGNQAN